MLSSTSHLSHAFRRAEVQHKVWAVIFIPLNLELVRHPSFALTEGHVQRVRELLDLIRSNPRSNANA